MDTKRSKTLKGFVTTSKESGSKRGNTGGLSLLELPIHLVHEIVSRLHVFTIFSCKCVCTTFYYILDDPQFAELHLTRSPYIDEEVLAIQDSKASSNLLFVYNCKLEPEKINLGHAFNPCQTLSIPKIAAQKYNVVSCVGSCNGLLCLVYRNRCNQPFVYICNPILGEFLAPPPDEGYGMKIKSIPPISSPFCGQAFAFGFSPKTKHYKVISFFPPSVCKIHTLGTNCWRTISNVPSLNNIDSVASSFRGNLHWIVVEFTISKFICSLNLEIEQASILPAPIHLNDVDIQRLSFIQTGSLNGLFCISYLLRENYEVYVMKDYGIKESWTKYFTINPLSISLRPYYGLKLMNNGDLFVYREEISSVCFNIDTGSVKHILARKRLPQVGYGPSLPSAMTFVPSFISLKDVAIASGGKFEVGWKKIAKRYSYIQSTW